ncbi:MULTISPECIES: hypothetical protein [unclassified Meridianimarinicoccus]|uniref:hypothetical protein n=1 Tax=unclassified Meridianimarinicoccus TaxID=2923344 RepID=UPI00186849AD|nr:hypothetical protein [Fluviibacterium sp. MJW13]
MRRNGWHMVKTDDGLTLARRLPARFDVEATTRLPRLRARVLAHEVRKDLWRLLRSQRGFSPVIELSERDGGLFLRAGGQIAGPVPGGLGSRIAHMLETPALRHRWATHARLRPTAAKMATRAGTKAGS